MSKVQEDDASVLHGAVLLASNGNSKFCCSAVILAILEQYRLLNRSYD